MPDALLCSYVNQMTFHQKRELTLTVNKSVCAGYSVSPFQVHHLVYVCSYVNVNK